MCGLVGIAGKIGWTEEKIFKTLLGIDTMRGAHSTGIASMSTVDNFRMAKDAVNGYAFIETPAYSSVMGGLHKILMGHNRFATRGAKTPDNAHPFEFDNLIGAHNGTLTTWYNLHDSKKFSVDSQALYSNINHEGIAETWKKLNGAAALTWINKEEKSINFIRNKERELYWTTINKGKTIVWASESWMLYVAISRENMDLDVKPVLFAEHEHVKLVPSNDGFSVEKETLEHYVAPKYSTYNGGYNYSGGDYYNAGKKHLEKENVGIKDRLYFFVERITDFSSYGVSKVNVYAITAKDTPVRIWNLDVGLHSDIIESMQMDNIMFSGEVVSVQETGITIAHSSIQRELGVTVPEGQLVQCTTCLAYFPAHQTTLIDGHVTCEECEADIVELSRKYH